MNEDKYTIVGLEAEARKVRHTPGTWTASYCELSDRWWVERRDSGLKSAIASTGPVLGHGGTAAANARLIASAPDLLAACERVLLAMEWSETSDRMSEPEQADVLRAAISRATGAVGA